MDLALLVYGIDLISSIKAFLIACTVITGTIMIGTGAYTLSWYFDGYEYHWDLKQDGTVKDHISNARNKVLSIFKKTIPCFFVVMFLSILIPSDKTAYTMVGAYAAQKIATDERTAEVGGKVLTIINQKLDSYVEEGIKKVK
jgi:hypothetical protein